MTKIFNAIKSFLFGDKSKKNSITFEFKISANDICEYGTSLYTIKKCIANFLEVSCTNVRFVEDTNKLFAKIEDNFYDIEIVRFKGKTNLYDIISHLSDIELCISDLKPTKVIIEVSKYNK